jgi:hypothetical protein
MSQIDSEFPDPKKIQDHDVTQNIFPPKRYIYYAQKTQRPKEHHSKKIPTISHRINVLYETRTIAIN